MSYMQLPEGDFRVVCPPGLWSRFSRVKFSVILSYSDMTS